jgi:putative oxidoreductase
VTGFNFFRLSGKHTYPLLRGVLGFIFITHGIARLYYSSVGEFGEFLSANSIFLGEVIAWIITIGEIIGGLFLLIGYKVKYVVIFHFLVIASGIVLVHFENGWFVVGHGRNGMEYNLLILVVLLFIFSREIRREIPAGE